MTCVGEAGFALSRAAAGAAAALTVQAASSATDLATRAVSNLATALERRDADQVNAEAALRAWHMAAAEVVGINATIRVAASRAAGLGMAADLPEPLDLAYRTVTEVADWIAEARPKVEAVRAALATAVVAGKWRRLAAALPVGVSEHPAVAEELARYQTVLRDHHRPAAAGPKPAGGNRGDLGTAVERVVAGLDPDATEADRERVLTAAAHILRQTDPADARTYLSALRRQVTKDVNPKAADRRRAAQWLEALEHAAVRDAELPDDPPWTSTIAELRAVVDGRTGLAPALVASARTLLDWAAAVARLRYRREVLADLLRERGYEVQVLLGDGRVAELRLARGDWQGEHTAAVWLDADHDVHVQLLREVGDAGDDAALRDRDRSEELGTQLVDVVHQLSHRGLTGLAVHTHRTQFRHETGTAAGQASTAQRTEPRVRRHGGPSDDLTGRYR